MQHGVTLHAFPDDVFAEIARASEDVVAATAADDDLGKRIYESYAAFRKIVAPTTRISEEAYSVARAKALNL